MEKLKNIPSLRFQEFDDKWMVKKFSALLKEGRLGGNYENSESNNGIPVIKMGNLGRGEININKVQFLPEGIEFNKEDILKKGDLLFNTRNTLELVGKVSIWRDELPFALYNSNLMRMKFNNEIEPSNVFMNYNFNTKNSINQLRCFATGTTSVAAIYGKDLKGFNVAFPTLPEQQKIASFLSAVDEKTQQLSRKKELLSQYKKGVMQQLFSGKLRFKDENGKDYADWEEKKLGDVCKLNPKSSLLPSSFIYIDLESVVNGQLLKETRIQLIEAPSRAQRLLSSEDILFQMVRPYQKNNLFFTRNGEYVASTGYAQLRAKESSMFLYQLIHTTDFVNKVIDRCTGTSYPAINSTDLSNIEISIPSIKEQQKIANFLSSIDTKIESTSQQITQTQSFKKGLLQQLFV